MPVKVQPPKVQELVRRPDFPKSSRPQPEQERALEHLLESYDGSVTRSLVDYQYLLRAGIKFELDEAAEHLTDFSRALDDRQEGRRALLEFERNGATRPELLESSLRLSQDLDKGVERWRKASAAEVSDQQRSSALELAARFDSDELLDSLLVEPPTQATLRAFDQLLGQMETPGVRPGKSWKVEQGQWLLQAQSGHHHDFDIDQLDFKGLLEPRLEFDVTHHRGAGDLRVTVKTPGVYGKHPTTDIPLGSGHSEVALGANGTMVELDVRPVTHKESVTLKLDNLKLVGQEAIEFARPEWRPRGDWGVSHSNRFDPVWSDSPLGDYRANRNDEIVSSAIDLRGCNNPHLAFELSTDIKGWGDDCYLEVRGEDGEWKELAEYDGEDSWDEHVLSLAEFKDQEVQFRFRLQTNGSDQEDGLEFTNFRILGSGSEEVSRPISGSTFDKGKRKKLVEAYLALEPEKREAAVELWARLAQDAQDISVPLDFWRAHQSERPLEPQLDAFLKLHKKHGHEAAKLLTRLNELPDKLEARTELMLQVSGSDYGKMIDFVQDSGTPLDYVLDLLPYGDAESIIDASQALQLPWGGEDVGERRDWFASLARRTGDTEKAISSWQTVGRWLPGNEEPKQVLEAYEGLYTALGGDIEETNQAWFTLQDWQMEGQLNGRSLEECSRLLARDLMLAPDDLNRLLGELRDGTSEIDFDQEDDCIVIGDIFVERG